VGPDLLFLLGAGIEIVALTREVSPGAVAVSLIVYGVVLLWTGYRV
jgi:hypothetical protein